MPDIASILAPFPKCSALHIDRLIDCSGEQVSPKPISNRPIGKTVHHIPGEPFINLVSTDVSSYLATELNTPLLDELYSHLWMVARRSGQSIDPLHAQKIKGRQVIPTEDPRLHLTWYKDKIYIKPIPICLLNYDFWTLYLSLAKDKEMYNLETQNPCQYFTVNFDRAVAMGFLRSYAFLVRHRLDLIIAQEFHLIPDSIEWTDWASFIGNFYNLDDKDVAIRYHYGQLRISRLNWVVRIFRPRNASRIWFYQLPHWSIREYIEQATIPLLFIFASISLVLSSMQVVVSVPLDGLQFEVLDNAGVRDMRRAFWAFSIIVLLLSAASWILLIGIPLAVLIWQLLWGFRHRETK